MQEVKILRSDYQRLVKEGKIRPDPILGDAVHVPEAGLPDFNEALRRGPPNKFTPEGK